MTKTTNKTPKSIAVVGGGTAGFVAALILKTRFPSINVSVIRSTKIGIIGVGEGSTEHWFQFMKHINVDHHTVIKECGATYKCGIMFQGWGEQDYLHNIQDEYNVKAGQYPFFYGRQIGEGLPPTELVAKRNLENQVNTWFLDKPFSSPTNQYHFNTHKLNEFLTKTCAQRGINVIDDEIKDLTINDSGEIDVIIGENDSYKYDFYIDSTGFRKLLISKLGAKWVSYSKYLKMNSAIVFPTDDTEEYNMWTIAKAMDYGWMFRIPVQGRGGNGYIFDSNYITAEQAQEEVEKTLGHKVNIGKHITFDPGALDNVWIKNCCAIGLSASFVEPLEASSIGSSIQQSFLLMHRIINYNDAVIDSYNKDVNDILINIRDFVALHYVTKKDNTQFWRDLQTVELPESLKEKLDIWKTRLPINEDFNDVSRYVMFTEAHHLFIMNGLGLFDKDSIKKEYEMYDPEIRMHADRIIDEQQTLINTTKSLPHKKMIEAIRSLT